MGVASYNPDQTRLLMIEPITQREPATIVNCIDFLGFAHRQCIEKAGVAFVVAFIARKERTATTKAMDVPGLLYPRGLTTVFVNRVVERYLLNEFDLISSGEKSDAQIRDWLKSLLVNRRDMRGRRNCIDFEQEGTAEKHWLLAAAGTCNNRGWEPFVVIYGKPQTSVKTLVKPG